jgi:hypothetical protein
MNISVVYNQRVDDCWMTTLKSSHRINDGLFGVESCASAAMLICLIDGVHGIL